MVCLTDVDILFSSSMTDLNSASRYYFIQNRDVFVLVGWSVGVWYPCVMITLVAESSMPWICTASPGLSRRRSSTVVVGMLLVSLVCSSVVLVRSEIPFLSPLSFFSVEILHASIIFFTVEYILCGCICREGC